MKTVILGDTHGRTFWQLIKEIEKPDRIVFVADYFDSHDDIRLILQLHNFKLICKEKKEGNCEVIMLVGNHDFHYTYYAKGDQYTNFQPEGFVAINSIITENERLLQAAYLLNNKFLITHAGVSNTWVKNNVDTLDTKTEGTIDQKINDVWLYKPERFNFSGIDSFGDDITQSPIWIRPRSLFQDRYKTENEDYYQIVGHTPVQKINHPGGGNKLYFVDALGTSLEYLVIDENNNVEIKKIM